MFSFLGARACVAQLTLSSLVSMFSFLGARLCGAIHSLSSLVSMFWVRVRATSPSSSR